jgi:hypothetical protein
MRSSKKSSRSFADKGIAKRGYVFAKLSLANFKWSSTNQIKSMEAFVIDYLKVVIPGNSFSGCES